MLLDIFCKIVITKTIAYFAFTTYHEYEQCTDGIQKFLNSNKNEAIEEFDKWQKEQNGAINMPHNNMMNNMQNQMMNTNNQMINNNMQNQNPMPNTNNLMINNNMINNNYQMMNNNIMNNNNNNPMMNNNNQNPIMNNNVINNNMMNNNMPNNMGNNNIIQKESNKLNMIEETHKESNRLNIINDNSANGIQEQQSPEINTNNINLYSRNSHLNNNDSHNGSEGVNEAFKESSEQNDSNDDVLKEDDYNKFIKDVLEHGTNLQEKYRGKNIRDPKTFQKKTNVCWLRRLFNCCTPTTEIVFDDIVRRSIDNNTTRLSCDNLIQEFETFLHQN